MLSYLSRFATRAPSTRVDERTRLKISDCDNRISLWFELDTPGERQNALHKIATLLDALHRFEEALKAEAELAARRDDP